MFAQRKEGFPSGGKKTASSLSRKRLMRGDKSALTQDIHPPYSPRSRIKRDSRTFSEVRTSRHTKNFPVRQPPFSKRRKSFHTNPAVAVQGSSGRVREVWRVGRPLRKGSPCASKVFPLPPPHHSKQTAEADGDSAHVGNLVDFDLRVNATRGLQNGANLVGRYRVNTATERD